MPVIDRGMFHNYVHMYKQLFCVMCAGCTNDFLKLLLCMILVYVCVCPSLKASVHVIGSCMTSLTSFNHFQYAYTIVPLQYLATKSIIISVSLKIYM